MSILCLWNPNWQTGAASAAELMPLLLEEAPRVALEERGVVWVDVRGLPGEPIARLLLARLARRKIPGVRAGIAARPIVAEGAARFGEGEVTVVPEGSEATFLADLPLTLLTSEEQLLVLLDGVGLRTCGDLAALSAEATEIRFGAEGFRLWSLARGDDRRLLFRPIPPERPHASIDFLDYTVQDATRLVFTLNALLDQVCEILKERARRARTITLTFNLSGGGRAEKVLRTARPTADRTLWMRRLRVALEEIKLSDSIAGVTLEAGAVESISALQGDLFDRGFATATFVEEAVGRLLDLYRGLFTRQDSSRHPLAERRTRWIDLTPGEAVGLPGEGEAAAEGGAPANQTATGGVVSPASGGLRAGRTVAERMEARESADGGAPALQLQLLDVPRPIRVRSRNRRDHVLPVSYLEGKDWQALTSAGPDRISGGHEEARSYAREYYRCVSDSGSLLWIYRDAIENRWFLHGWWD